MYKLLLITIAGVLGASLPTKAQERVSIHSAGTYFVQPVKDKKWSNENGEDFTRASYKFYTGLTYITLLANGDDALVELYYDIIVKEGELTMEVVNEQGNSLFAQTFSATATGNTKIALKQDDVHRVTFKGNSTSGSYHLKWKKLAP